MNKLIHFPYNYHETIANAYDLELVQDDGNILIVRDPFDTAFEQLVDRLDEQGNPENLTIEEYLFIEKNKLTKQLGLERIRDIREFVKTRDFVWFSSYITWPKISALDLYPKEQTVNHELYNMKTVNQKLSEFLGVEDKNISVNTRFESNMLDTSLRADFASWNSLDYDLINHIKMRLQGRNM
jgi:hypothetical protein